MLGTLLMDYISGYEEGSFKNKLRKLGIRRSITLSTSIKTFISCHDVYRIIKSQSCHYSEIILNWSSSPIVLGLMFFGLWTTETVDWLRKGIINQTIERRRKASLKVLRLNLFNWWVIKSNKRQEKVVNLTRKYNFSLSVGGRVCCCCCF